MPFLYGQEPHQRSAAAQRFRQRQTIKDTINQSVNKILLSLKSRERPGYADLRKDRRGTRALNFNAKSKRACARACVGWTRPPTMPYPRGPWGRRL